MSTWLAIYLLGVISAACTLVLKFCLILLRDFQNGSLMYRANVKRIGVGYNYLHGEYLPLDVAQSYKSPWMVNWIFSAGLSWLTTLTELFLIFLVLMSFFNPPHAHASDRMKELIYPLFRTNALTAESVWARVMGFEILMGMHNKPGEILIRLSDTSKSVSEFDAAEALRQLRLLNLEEVNVLLLSDGPAA